MNDKQPELSKQELSQKVGERIKSIRSGLGISQAELARRCNKDSQHIELIENGKVTATIYTLYIVARALGVTLDELLKLD
jgi:putative transcriptional regulator